MKINVFLMLMSLFACLEAQIPMININNTIVSIEKGDITKCTVQAIVNAANEQLQGGAGVCGAIFNAAGWDKLQDACYDYPEKNTVRCSVGNACITDSFALKNAGIEYIIHAVGPDCRIVKDPDAQNSLLKSAYQKSLELADSKSLTSIAFPFISSAIYAFPKERAAQIALKTIAEYAQTNKTNIASIRFVLFSQEDYDLFGKSLQSIDSSKQNIFIAGLKKVVSFIRRIIA